MPPTPHPPPLHFHYCPCIKTGYKTVQNVEQKSTFEKKVLFRTAVTNRKRSSWKTEHGSSAERNRYKILKMHKIMGLKFIISSDLRFVANILSSLTISCADNQNARSKVFSHPCSLQCVVYLTTRHPHPQPFFSKMHRIRDIYTSSKLPLWMDIFNPLRILTRIYNENINHRMSIHIMPIYQPRQ